MRAKKSPPGTKKGATKMLKQSSRETTDALRFSSIAKDWRGDDVHMLSDGSSGGQSVHGVAGTDNLDE